MAQLPKQVQKLLDIIEGREHMEATTVKNPLKANLGAMYLMVYDPKWKNELPFYDVLPMFVLIGKAGDRWLGVNLHYCPYTWRVSLAKELMKMFSWKKRIQYKDIVKAFKAAKAPMGYLYMCIRTYLYSHIRSEVKMFDYQNYDQIVENVMPKFKKAGEEYIYKTLMSKFYKKTDGIRGTSKK